jgi:hypothetical protein
MAALILCAFLLKPAPGKAGQSEKINEQEAYKIGVEAYIYFYPLVTMDITRKMATNVPAGLKEGCGPMNAFHHMRSYPDVQFRGVVRPNFDTLYSSAWLDLTKEPVIITVPDTGGRYYLLPMLDMWSDVFAVLGKRTSGTNSASFAVVPKGWKGKLPKGVDRIESPTPYVWIIGRTQTNGPKDYEAVYKIQDGYKITPLSLWGKMLKLIKAIIVNPTVDFRTPPVVQVETMPAAKYFSYGAELMKVNPPHITDWSQIARLKRIGIEPGKSFEFDKAPNEIKAALERAVADGQKLMKQKKPTLARIINGWQMNTDTMGVYGNYYLKRAIVAQALLGANQPEDAIYPVCLADADGNPLNGANKYVVHFSKDELPPVDAFWSITMYDEQGFQVANKINRFAIGDRDNLKYNDDGSLDIYMQNQSPGEDKESNWLPAPSQGVLGVTMRLYAPRAQALDGRWNPPAVRKTQ